MYPDQNVQHHEADTAAAGTKRQKRSPTRARDVPNAKTDTRAIVDNACNDSPKKKPAMYEETTCVLKVVECVRSRLLLKDCLNVWIPPMVVAGILPLPWDLEERDVESVGTFIPEFVVYGTGTASQMPTNLLRKVWFTDTETAVPSRAENAK